MAERELVAGVGTVRGMDDARSDILAYYAAYYRPGVIDLSNSGAPTRPFPLEGACGALEDVQYVPPTGAEELREAIAGRYETVSPDEVLVTAGASEALAALALALVRPGTRVVADRGTYPSFVEAAKTAGANVLIGRRVEAGDSVAAYCHPTTPDGRILPFARELECAGRAGALAVVDEVYRDLGHHGAHIPAAVDLDAMAVSVSGLSKPLGLGGLRIGWIASHNRPLLERLDRQLQLLSGGPASLSVRAARVAFEQYDERVGETLAGIVENAPRVYAELRAAGWRFCPPAAGLAVEAWPPDPISREAEQRLSEAGFFLVPCDVYGTPGAYRIGLLSSPTELRRALAMLAAETNDGGPSPARHRRVSRLASA